MWNQTWPLFMPPYAVNMLMLSALSFILFLVSYGLNLWFPQITAIYQTFLNIKITTCGAIEMGLQNKTITVNNNVYGLKSKIEFKANYKIFL